MGFGDNNPQILSYWRNWIQTLKYQKYQRAGRWSWAPAPVTFPTGIFGYLYSPGYPRKQQPQGNCGVQEGQFPIVLGRMGQSKPFVMGFKAQHQQHVQS